MPRKPRFAPVGYPFHVTNRGNDRRQIFFADTDYREFLRLLAVGKQSYAVKVFAVCLMPNHVHVLVQPLADGALSDYLQWVLGCYACNLRSVTRTIGYGHVFRGRFWNDGIKDERQFLAVLRYIEANPCAAGLVARAEEWPWSSLSLRRYSRYEVLDPLPLVLPVNWSALVNTPQPCNEVTAITHPVNRGRPKNATSHQLQP